MPPCSPYYGSLAAIRLVTRSLSATQAERARVREAAAAAGADVTAKLAAIGRVEAAMRRADAETERKTRALQGLNRRLQRLMEAAPDAETLGAAWIRVRVLVWVCVHTGKDIGPAVDNA